MNPARPTTLAALGDLLLEMQTLDGRELFAAQLIRATPTDAHPRRSNWWLILAGPLEAGGQAKILLAVPGMAALMAAGEGHLAALRERQQSQPPLPEPED